MKITPRTPLGRVFAVAGALLLSGPAMADISVNFSENSGNQIFAGGENIGPLSSDSANWNLTDNFDAGGSLAAGTLSALTDDAGNATGASVSWGSSNTWFNSDGTADDEHKMAVGYLDDGDSGNGVGIRVTFSDIPYDRYEVLGLLASDGGDEYESLDFTVNGVSAFGAATAPAFGNIETSLAQTGSFWSLADGTARGNYWSVETSGATLTITGNIRDDALRGSITSVIVREVVPEPSTMLLLGLGAVAGLGLLRRKQSS